jgi:hypothetical protein
VQCRCKVYESTLIRVQAERLNKPILSYQEKQRQAKESKLLVLDGSFCQLYDGYFKVPDTSIQIVDSVLEIVDTSRQIVDNATQIVDNARQNYLSCSLKLRQTVDVATEYRISRVFDTRQNRIFNSRQSRQFARQVLDSNIPG